MPKTSMPAPRMWQALCAIEQLTLLQPFAQTDAALAFCEMGRALFAKDITLATQAKARLNGSLLQPVRRICGDVWRDYVLHWLLFMPSRFAELAACGEVDPFVTSAMAHDLALLQAVFRCDGAALNEEVKALCAFMEAPVDDVIALMAGVAWGGGELKESVKTRKPVGVIPLTFDEWIYDTPVFEADYACDEALEGIYAQFFAEESWSGKLCIELRQLFATYGTGEFLQHASFMYTASGLHACGLNAQPWDTLLGVEAAKQTLLDDALFFLHGEGVRHVWLCGAGGMGKSALVRSLAQTLGALRLVHVPPHSQLDPMPLLQTLKSQPLHFLVLFDGTRPDAPELVRARQCLENADIPNVMLVATSRQAPEDTFFAHTLAFEPPTLRVFIEIVLDMAKRQGVALDYDLVQNAAIDWQRAEDDLSLHAAARLCEQLMA